MIGLGEIIQVKRKELGLTQERLAEKIGKTAGYIGQIERGLSYPSYPVLLQLIETLELDVQSLFCTSTLEESENCSKNTHNSIPSSQRNSNN